MKKYSVFIFLFVILSALNAENGVQQILKFQRIWDKVEPFNDNQRFSEVQSKHKILTTDAVWWKDTCLLYFQTFSKRNIPYEIECPLHELDSLKKLKLNMKHHN